MRFAWIDEPPFNFVAPGGLTGLDVELIREVRRLLDEPFEPVETRFSDLLPGLANGRWDVTTGVFMTPERSAIAAFTQPIWRLADGLLVQRTTLLSGYRDLACAGLSLAVLRDQEQHRTALRAGVANIKVLETHAEATEAIRAGLIDAYASVALAHGRAVREDPALACLLVAETERPSSLGAFACASDGVRYRVDGELTRLIRSDWHETLLARFGLDRTTMPPPVGVGA